MNIIERLKINKKSMKSSLTKPPIFWKDKENKNSSKYLGIR